MNNFELSGTTLLPTTIQNQLSIKANHLLILLYFYALIQSMIRMEHEDAKLVAGHWEISGDERAATFFPEMPWKKGTYRVIMDGRLEDVSGNNLNNLLDQKIKAKNELDPVEISRKFTI